MSIGIKKGHKPKENIDPQTIDYQPIYFFGFNPKKVNIYKAKTTRKQAKMTILCIS